jgi:hypothetical protein
MGTALPIWGAIIATVALIMAFARTGPEEAKSKLSEWAAAFRLDRLASWLAAHALDQRVLRYGQWAMLVLLFIGGMLFESWLSFPSRGYPDAMKERISYLSNTAFSAPQNPREKEPPALIFSGDPLNTTSRLRIFVDYSAYAGGWLPVVRVPITEILQPVKDVRQYIPLLYEGRVNEQMVVWFGHPNSDQILPRFSYSLQYAPHITPIRMRAVILLLDAGDKEQHEYAFILESGDSTQILNGARFLIVGQETGDWVRDWETK